MKGTLYLKTAPTAEPVTLTEAKSYLRVDVDAHDSLIGTLITAARKWVEGTTGIRMMPQTWNYYLDGFPSEDTIRLPIGPVSAVSSVKYTPKGGPATVFSTDNYAVDSKSLPARVRLKSGASWPSSDLEAVNGVDIEFVAGYGAADTMVAAQAALTAAKALAAAAVTDGEKAAAMDALVAAEALVTAAQTAAATAVPEDLRSAVLMLVLHWYEHPGAVTEMTLADTPLALRAILPDYEMHQRGA